MLTSTAFHGCTPLVFDKSIGLPVARSGPIKPFSFSSAIEKLSLNPSIIEFEEAATSGRVEAVRAVARGDGVVAAMRDGGLVLAVVATP
jgi:hypothetical protein